MFLHDAENVSAVMDEYKNHVEAQFLLKMDLCPHVSGRKWISTVKVASGVNHRIFSCTRLRKMHMQAHGNHCV